MSLNNIKLDTDIAILGNYKDTVNALTTYIDGSISTVNDDFQSCLEKNCNFIGLDR